MRERERERERERCLIHSNDKYVYTEAQWCITSQPYCRLKPKCRKITKHGLCENYNKPIIHVARAQFLPKVNIWHSSDCLVQLGETFNVAIFNKGPMERRNKAVHENRICTKKKHLKPFRSQPPISSKACYTHYHNYWL